MSTIFFASGFLVTALLVLYVYVYRYYMNESRQILQDFQESLRSNHQKAQEELELIHQKTQDELQLIQQKFESDTEQMILSHRIRLIQLQEKFIEDENNMT